MPRPKTLPVKSKLITKSVYSLLLGRTTEQLS